MLVVFGISAIVGGVFLALISAVKDELGEFLVGLLATVGGLFFFALGIYEVGNKSVISEISPTIEECQKELPRDENCIMVAIPEKLLEVD